MRFFVLFSHVGFSNAYLLGPREGGDAVLIDPGTFDTALLQAVESNGLYVRSIFVTHAHNAHINGIRSLLKVYKATIYSNQPSILDFPARHVGDGDTVSAGNFEVGVRATPGHSMDSVSLLIRSMVFTGDALTAGGIGETRSGYARGVLLSAIRRQVLSLPDSTLIFPGHGPPSTVGAERLYNPYLGGRL